MPFNEILVGRLNRWVQKLLVIKNTALLDLSPNLQPVIMMESGVEERYLQGWERFGFTVTQAAIAAQSSAVQIRNPAGSGVIFVLEKANILAGASSLCQLFLTVTSADLATVYTPGALRIDKRGRSNPTAIISSGQAGVPTNAANPAFRMISPTTANTEFIATDNQEWTVLPGDALVGICELVNTQVSVAMMWRERVLESSELT